MCFTGGPHDLTKGTSGQRVPNESGVGKIAVFSKFFQQVFTGIRNGGR